MFVYMEVKDPRGRWQHENQEAETFHACTNTCQLNSSRRTKLLDVASVTTSAVEQVIDIRHTFEPFHITELPTAKEELRSPCWRLEFKLHDAIQNDQVIAEGMLVLPWHALREKVAVDQLITLQRNKVESGTQTSSIQALVSFTTSNEPAAVSKRKSTGAMIIWYEHPDYGYIDLQNKLRASHRLLGMQAQQAISSLELFVMPKQALGNEEETISDSQQLLDCAIANGTEHIQAVKTPEVSSAGLAAGWVGSLTLPTSDALLVARVHLENSSQLAGATKCSDLLITSTANGDRGCELPLASTARRAVNCSMTLRPLLVPFVVCSSVMLLYNSNNTRCNFVGRIYHYGGSRVRVSEPRGIFLSMLDWIDLLGAECNCMWRNKLAETQKFCSARKEWANTQAHHDKDTVEATFICCRS